LILVPKHCERKGINPVVSAQGETTDPVILVRVENVRHFSEGKILQYLISGLVDDSFLLVPLFSGNLESLGKIAEPDDMDQLMGENVDKERKQA
jgi:hypothetical protein